MSQHLVLIDALGGHVVLAPVDLTKPGLKILDSGTADGMFHFRLENNHRRLTVTFPK